MRSPTDRRSNLFFALGPDPETAARISILAEIFRREQGLIGRATAPERMHVSLNSLGRRGEVSERTIVAACEAASRVDMRSFVVAFDRVMSFRNPVGPQPLVLVGDDGVIGVHALHGAIHEALVRAGAIRRAERYITPHLTLLRDRRAVPETFVPTVSWRVRDFVLIESFIGEGRHEVLGRWRLG